LSHKGYFIAQFVINVTKKNKYLSHIKIKSFMKRIFCFAILLISSIGYAQTLSTYEKPPTFSECESESIDQIKSCFNYTLNTFIYKNFEVPQVSIDEDYKK